ncbi:MAG: AAA family ATPase, partial [Clostridia bacterium]|nr:AAA family ATPase [Clostridia bacterium]
MSNYLQTVKELSACIAARTPLVVLMTDERDRARAALKEAANELNCELEFYTDTDGFIELRREERGADSREPLVYIEDRLKKKSGLCFALSDMRFLDADNSFSRKTAALARLASERKSTIILVTADTVWQGLGRLGMFIKLDLPTQKEREKQLLEFISKHKIKTLEKSMISQTATVLSGYTSLQLNIVMNYAFKIAGGFTYENLCEVAMQKDKLFGKNIAVTRVQVESVHAAGLNGVKNWLSKKEKIFFAPKDALDKKHISPPRGILMVGVPGCGKSLSAKLIADKWCLPLYRFDIGSLFDKYVGESEKNLRISLDYISSVSPCIVWIDEIEKVLYSGGDNDTVKRILGGLLYWLQENSDRVFL